MNNRILMLSILVIFATMAQNADAVRWCDDYIEAWHYDSNWNLVGYTFVHNHVVERYWGTDKVPNHYVDSWTVCGKKRMAGIDPTAPVISVLSPENKYYDATESIVIQASADDPESGINTFRMSIDGTPVTSGDTITLSKFGYGQHLFTVFASNNQGDYTLVLIPFNVVASSVDTLSPDISCSVTPRVLWPPNGKMVPIDITANIVDDKDTNPSWKIIGVSTNDLTETVEDLQTLAELVSINGQELQLRATKAHQTDRIYKITIMATDNSANKANCNSEIKVPYNGRSEI